MDTANTVISIIYYALVAWVAVVLVNNLVKSRRWERELLYVVVLVPFLLRLFRLK